MHGSLAAFKSITNKFDCTEQQYNPVHQKRSSKAKANEQVG